MIWEKIVREGDLAPSIPGGVILGEVGGSFIEESTNVIVSANLVGPGVDMNNDSALWYQEAGGNLELLARKGDTAPAIPTAELLTRPGLTMSPDGQFGIMYGKVLQSGVNGFNSEVLWRWQNDVGWNVVARGTEVAPGTIHQFEDFERKGH